MGIDREFWRGKRVFVTGHSGFKGGWLALWLNSMGADVIGYALSPPTDTNLFTVANIGGRLEQSIQADIRDAAALLQAVKEAKPDIVFHMAAQSLVRYSYLEPTETYAVNVLGLVNLLEAVRQTPSIRAVVNITTDKCYENHGGEQPYKEGEPLGGYDPYSSSKACSEIVTAAYRQSFLAAAGVQIATARAGNVIGGGDWAQDRLLPDFLRCIDAGEKLIIRSPESTRPWQHVIEPLAGYLVLAEKLVTEGQQFSDSWNFGPQESDAKSVKWIVEYLCSQRPGVEWTCDFGEQPHEANVLVLDSSKARSQLGWRPRLGLETALGMTLAWHQAWKQSEDMRAMCLEQIKEYDLVVGQHDIKV